MLLIYEGQIHEQFLFKSLLMVPDDTEVTVLTTLKEEGIFTNEDLKPKTVHVVTREDIHDVPTLTEDCKGFDIVAFSAPKNFAVSPFNSPIVLACNNAGIPAVLFFPPILTNSQSEYLLNVVEGKGLLSA